MVDSDAPNALPSFIDLPNRIHRVLGHTRLCLVRASLREARTNASDASSRAANYLGYQSPPFAPAPANLKVQGVFIRGIAWLLDSIVLGIVIAVVFMPVTLAVLVAGPSVIASFNASPVWAAVVVTLIVQFAYFTVLEGRYGQTLGKFVSEIKVVNENGSRVGYKAAALRTILRPLDFLPVLYGVGVLLIWSSDKRQRLGDIVAHTIVISHVRYTSV